MWMAFVRPLADATYYEEARIALLDCIAAAHLHSGEVCDLLGYSQSQWAKIARGEAGHRLPSVDRVILGLPHEVALSYLTKLAAIKFRQFVNRGIADATLRRSV